MIKTFAIIVYPVIDNTIIASSWLNQQWKYMMPKVPDTKTMILDATLEIILEYGVRGTTYRKIAEKTKLSLGTLTYRYNSIDHLMLDAFQHMVNQIARAFHQRLLAAQSIESAREAVVDLICGDVWATPRHLMLSFELYALASRNAEYRRVLQSWMRCSRNALQEHFSPEIACSIDVMIEGYTIHNFLNVTATGRSRILDDIIRITS